jgi:RNA polymerase sigma-70 factor (ECF subfamily)
MHEADLERLYARLEKPLYNVVYRWVWSAEEAADLVQEAFVRLWRMRDRVVLDRAEALVYRIALNLAASRRRSKRVWRWVSLEALRGTSTADSSAEQALLDEQRHGRVRDAVDALPDDLRRVVVMTECTGMTYDEIGGILKIPAGTVGSRRNRALKQLRGLLSDEGTIDEPRTHEPV